jgi:transcriptional regulator with XRE-family HTH domain
MNRCTALRGMIAGGGGYAVGNAAAGKEKAASTEAKPLPEKATARLGDWKAHGPVLNIPVKNYTPPIRKPNFKPHRLLDAVIEKMFLPSDAALARMTHIHPNSISKYRSGKVSISWRMLKRMHETTDIPFQKLLALRAEMNPPATTKKKPDNRHSRKHNANPHRLLDAVIDKMRLANDVALGRRLQFHSRTIGRLRNGEMLISPRMLKCIHEASDIPMDALLALLDASNADNGKACGMENQQQRSSRASTKSEEQKKNVAAQSGGKTVNSHRLLDAAIDKMNLKNDAALSKTLGIAPPTISKLRHGRISVGPSMLIRIHEATDIPIRKLRALMSDDACAQDQGNAAANETRE